MKKVSWGVLSTAKMGVDRAIPAMQAGALCSIDAIASRDLARAERTAQALGIGKAYGSYEELLADPQIEAIYNPLPNHLHVDWTLRALAAGKHVLCEKPLGLTADDAARLLRARQTSDRLVTEAFMVRFHPQWKRAREIIASGRLGKVRCVQGFFSYNNPDPNNIRNILDVGGGGLMDIGCYMILLARLVFGTEPRRVISLIDRDPKMQTDRIASCLMEFPGAQASFTCATQLARHQRFQILGAQGRLEIEIPVNAPDDRPCRIVVDDGRDVVGSGREVIEIPTCNQYTLQGDAVSAAIRDGGKAPMSLEDSIANMRVIDAIFRSESSGRWESP